MNCVGVHVTTLNTALIRGCLDCKNSASISMGNANCECPRNQNSRSTCRVTAKDGQGLCVACCGSMLLLRAAPLCGGAAPGVGGQRRAGKPLGGEGNAMQRTASRDGATPCTLPLEKQLQQNLQATLLKQNGYRQFLFHR